MTQGLILGHPPWTGPKPGGTHLLTEGESWAVLQGIREGGEMAWAVPKGEGAGRP